ncbi:DUF2155 domain-containing protein [Rickettsia endosymbiont of Cardiosporidium cionae]|uniref:DUF2155 domain-containing protein n=1 Tax=Rickettsia endosymbiont of Cardiosporidium cionae TaxID=2777155 RepID=UPI001895A1EF|nr:DUF2155 domain-containing protein [Rickettsia endosymbiont of Cardiosporidium cionae]KAF8818316.1 hypothetical protein IHI24_000776 [Rickettsia endosymbiont of Cardiosporidium cionae]
MNCKIIDSILYIKISIILIFFTIYPIYEISNEEIDSKIIQDTKVIQKIDLEKLVIDLEKNNEFEDYIKQYPNLKEHQYANIVVMNKITTEASNMTLQLNTRSLINNLSIEVQHCVEDNNIYQPGYWILMSIHELSQKEKKKIFYGWILSSNPSISNIIHPVYEIIPLKCFSQLHQNISDDKQVK